MPTIDSRASNLHSPLADLEDPCAFTDIDVAKGCSKSAGGECRLLSNITRDTTLQPPEGEARRRCRSPEPTRQAQTALSSLAHFKNNRDYGSSLAHAQAMLTVAIGESVTQLNKLMDVCRRCESFFDTAGKIALDDRTRQLAEQIYESVSRIGFELQKEIRRLEPGSAGIQTMVRPSVGVDDFENASRECLQEALTKYRAAIESRVPAHARAMIRRQYCQLNQVYEELTQNSEAA